MTTKKDNEIGKETQSITTTMCLVMADIAKAGIGKNQATTFGEKYKYRGIDDIHNTLAPILAEHGLIILPNVLEREIRIGQTKSGGVQEQIHLKVEYNFYHIHNDQTKSMTIYGEAFDTSDKAIAKALSICYKYMAIQAFSIPVVGSEDQDAHQPEVTVGNAPKKNNPDVALIKNNIQELYSICTNEDVINWMDKESKWKESNNMHFLKKLEERLISLSGINPVSSNSQ